MTRFQHDDTDRASAALDAFFTRNGIKPHPTNTKLKIECANNGCLISWGGASEGVFVSLKEGQQLVADLGPATELPDQGWKI